MNKVFFGLYRKTSVGHYEGGGHTRENLMGIDSDKESLVKRYNENISMQHKRSIEKGEHESYRRYIDKPIPDGKFEVDFAGSTGGGCAWVDNKIFIQQIKQFDDVKNDNPS